MLVVGILFIIVIFLPVHRVCTITVFSAIFVVVGQLFSLCALGIG